MLRTRLILVASFVLFSIFHEDVKAESYKPEPKSFHHILDDHAFLPSLVIPNPFSDSNVILISNFAYGTTTAITANGPEELKLGAFRPAFSVQVEILKGLALSAGINASQVTGLNGTSVLNYGASVSYTYSFGATYELIRSDSTVFSLALDVLRPHSIVVTPVNAAQAGVTAFIQESDPSYVNSTISTQWRPMVRTAHALSSVFGILGGLGLNLNSYNQGQGASSTSKLVIAAGVDADLDPAISVPVGLSFGYQRNQALSLGGLNSDNFAVGIFETFQKSFNTGIQLGKSYVGDKNVSIGSVLVRVYFN